MVEVKKEVAKVKPYNGKILTIKLSNLKGDPEFIFDGDWAGKDVRVILRHITMAYRKNQITKAKAMATRQLELATIGDEK